MAGNEVVLQILVQPFKGFIAALKGFFEQLQMLFSGKLSVRLINGVQFFKVIDKFLFGLEIEETGGFEVAVDKLEILIPNCAAKRGGIEHDLDSFFLFFYFRLHFQFLLGVERIIDIKILVEIRKVNGCYLARDGSPACVKKNPFETGNTFFFDKFVFFGDKK